MPEVNLCKEQILSEDYRDFIVGEIRTSFLQEITNQTTCRVQIETGYQSVYISGAIADPITFERYSYNAVPKCFTLLSMETLNQAGILQIQNYPTLQLKGAGVMLGFIDTGIDFENPIFRNLDGTTRIEGIWDQTIQTGNPPAGLAYGSEYTKEIIDQALQSENPKETVPTADENGHGTFVASVACGGANAEQQFLGAAPEASIGVVKLKPAKQYLKEFYRIAEDAVCYQENDIMLAMKYLRDLAESKNLPLVFCVALGTTAGGQSGNLPLSVLIRRYSDIANFVVVTGTGNEANQRHHYQGMLEDEEDVQEIDIRVGENSLGFYMETWSFLPNILSVSLTSPSGETTEIFSPRRGISTTVQFLLDRTIVNLEYRIPVENTASELIAMRFQNPSAGIWRLRIQGSRIADGVFHMWLPMTEFLNSEIYFLESNPDVTITTPGDVLETITTAYYDGQNNSLYPNSGRGFTRANQVKPDFSSPGVNVTGALPDGRFVQRTGSSAAVSITAGAAALLLEWILFQLGAPAIGATELKSLFILGVQQKRDVQYPSKEWGYGTLDVYNIFEQIRRI